MKIESLIIKGLYRIYNYDIDFNKYENPFILTGMNGMGKTTILNIINNICIKNYYYFYQLTFESIEFRFENNYKIILNKMAISTNVETDLIEDRATDLERNLEIRLITNDKENKITLNKRNIDRAYKELRYHLPSRSRIHSHSERIDSEVKYSKEYINDNLDVYNTLLLKAQEGRNIELLLEALKVSFINSQRVYEIKRTVRGEYSIDSNIIKVNNNLQLLIQDINLNYLKKSIEVDSSAIKKQLEDNSQGYSKSEYESEYNNLSPKIEKLKEYGLIPFEEVYKYRDGKGQVLKTYIEGLKDKIKEFDPIIDKLNLFSEIIAEKEFYRKKIKFSKSEGIEVFSDIGEKISIDSLSSGEKQQIILLYWLIFESKKDSLLLIDEPEISLHIAWQFNFIKDLEKIVKLNDLQVIIATHSPQIIAERWEHNIELAELAK